MIKKEFKHLDALRGIMAMYVTLVHFIILFTLNKKNELVFTDLRYLGIVQLGQVFMTVFFVLSGFLISYILLIEKEQTANVNFKKFYLRRAFRILPMYYLGVFSMFFLYKKACINPTIMQTPMCAELSERSYYYFLLLPNWAHAIDKTLPHISNYWSIGAEEQFYILWPFVLYFSKNYLRSFFGIYIAYCCLLIAMVLVGNLYYHNDNITFINIAKLFDYTRFGAFAFGGVIAFVLLHNTENTFQKYHLLMTKKSVQWSCFLLPFIVCIIPNEHVLFLKHILVIPCCAVTVYNFAFDEQSILKIDNKYLNYIGKTTYSLYILNQIVIDFVIKICFAAKINSTLIVFVITMFILFLGAVFCYEFIEKPFMQLRRKFG